MARRSPPLEEDDDPHPEQRERKEPWKSRLPDLDDRDQLRDGVAADDE